jgi:hypothetical protein
MVSTGGSAACIVHAYLFPVSIPAGTRIAVRGQQAGSGTISFQTTLILGSGTLMAPSPLGVTRAYGALTASSDGAAIDPGGTANTKGAWTELVAATTEPIRWLNLAVGTDARNIGTLNDFTHVVDLGVGAGGSEVVVLPDVKFQGGQGLDMLSPPAIALPVNIPAGVRLAARSACSTNNATERLFDVAVYGTG